MTAAAEATPDSARADKPQPIPATREADAMLEAIDALCASLAPRLANGLAIVRDNPGRTPQQWSVKDGDGATVVSFGLIDRTFFWTWDQGVSNHYAKSRETVTRIVTGELARFGHLSDGGAG